MPFQPSDRLLELFEEEQRGNRAGAARIAREILTVTTSPDERMMCSHIALLDFIERTPESALEPGNPAYFEMRDLLAGLFEGYEAAQPETRHMLETWPDMDLAGLRRMLETMRGGGSLHELMAREIEQSMTADERLRFQNRQLAKSLIAWVVIIALAALLAMGCVGVCGVVAAVA